MTKKKKYAACVELAMVRDACGVAVPRKLPAPIESIKKALRAKELLGLPVELSQAECRDISATAEDLTRLLKDPKALESRKETNKRRAWVQEMVRKYL